MVDLLLFFGGTLKKYSIFSKSYDEKFKKIKEVSLLPSNSWSDNSFWLYTFVINNIGEKTRDKLLMLLKDRGIECRPAFYPLNLMRPYKKFARGNFEVSEYLGTNSISLPSSSALTNSEQNHIVDIFLEELNNLNVSLKKVFT